VKAWVEDHQNQIALFFLPAYSPERNPDEYLNGDMKQTIGQLRPPKDREELETNVKSHLRRLSKSPNRVASYFRNPKIAYAA